VLEDKIAQSAVVWEALDKHLSNPRDRQLCGLADDAAASESCRGSKAAKPSFRIVLDKHLEETDGDGSIWRDQSFLLLRKAQIFDAQFPSVSEIR
jgi:hypothetical protein